MNQKATSPESPLVSIERLVQQARLAIDRDDQNLALKIVKAAVTRDPFNPSVLAQAGRLFRVRAQYDRSQRFLRIAAVSAPEAWSSWADLGELHHEMGDTDSVIRFRSRAFRALPLASGNLLALAATLLEVGKLAPASRMFKRGLLAYPRSEASRIGYAKTLLASDATRDLTRETGRLAKTITKFASVERRFVDQLLRGRQFGAAELILKPVARGLPGNPLIWRALALTREFVDDFKAARDAIRRAMMISPSDFLGQRILSRIQISNHPREDPGAAIRRLLVLAGTVPSGGQNFFAAWVLRGGLAIKNQAFIDAARAYRHALTVSPDDDAAMIELAYARFASGDENGAKRSLLLNGYLTHRDTPSGGNQLATLKIETVAAYCRRAGVPYQTVARAFDVDREPRPAGPNHFGPKGAFDLRIDGWLQADGSVSANRFPVPETFLGRVDNALVIPPQFSVVTEENTALLEGLFYHTPARLNVGPCFAIMAPDNRILAELPSSSENHDVEAVLIGGSQNYYHCLLDWFSRLSVIAANPALADMPLVVSANMPAAAVEFIRLLGMEGNRLITLSDQPARFAKLWLPSLAHGRYGFTSPKYLEFLETRLLSKFRDRGRPGRRRLYISRRGGVTRRILNERELVEALRKLDFEIVHGETLSAREQLSLFGDAEIIVGVIGAGLTNILAAPTNTAVIELTHSHSLRVNIEVLAGLLGHRFTRLLGRRDSQGKTTPAHSDFVVPVDKLVETITAQI
jgi:tetratricopeptide (TPR) repeat protein